MSTPSRFYNSVPVLSSKASAGTGNCVGISDFKNVVALLTTSGSATLTVKIQGSAAENKPDFSISASASNPWDYVAVYDYSDPSSVIPGATGISAAGTDVCKNLLVNIDGLNWLSATVTSRSAGSANLVLANYTNQ